MRPAHPFLNRFPERDRSTISNWFLEPIRWIAGHGGTISPGGIVEAVLKRATEMLRYDYSRPRAELTIALIGEFEEEARDYALDRIRYERLSGPEKAAIKAENARQGWRTWENQKPPYARTPITERQRWKLESLGVPPEKMPEDKAAASQMIDELMTERAR